MEWLESRAVRPRQARYQAALRPDMKCAIDSKALSNATATPIRLSVQVKIRRARGSKKRTGGYGVARATVGSSESSRTRIGVCTGNSTFEPLVMNASQSLFAAPKYPNPIAVPTDACAGPAPSKPKPLVPSPASDQARFSVY